jgi:hypothetical protein
MRDGTQPKPTMCAGCKLSLNHCNARTIYCTFAQDPFPNIKTANSPPLRACGIAYHPKCIRVRPQFLS